MPVSPAPRAPAAGVAFTVADDAAARGGDFDDLTPINPPAGADPRAVVRAVAQAGGYKLAETAGTWDITVPIGALRKQIVQVAFEQKDDEGHEIVSYSSTCGPFSEKNAPVFLRYNAKTLHAAFAVEKREAGEMVVLRANQLANTLEPLSVTRIIAAIAWQADKVEEKLLGRDDY
jgi:hypothetical protein